MFLLMYHTPGINLSKILMRGNKKNNIYTVEIGGTCVYVGKGAFEINECTR